MTDLEPPRPARRHRSATGPALVTASLLAGLLVAGCSSDASQGNDPRGNDTSPAITYPAVSPSPAATVAPADLLSQAQNYDGQRVTTTGTVRSLGPFLLALSAPSGGQTAGASGSGGATGSATGSATGTATGATGNATGSGGGSSASSSSQPIGPNEILVINGLPGGPADGSQTTLTGTFHRSFDASMVVQSVGMGLPRGSVEQLGLDRDTRVLITDGAMRPSDGNS